MAHAPALNQAISSSRRSADRSHRLRVSLAAAAAAILLLSLSVYGFDYYRLPIEMRPFSAKHEILRPSGTIGLKLGILGTVLFAAIFLYAVRKALPWLGRLGTTKHWMDFHVVAGVTAPIVIAFHASFKFNNIAGVAFWVMLAVALSGIAGRYLYAQIPRSLGSAALTYNELHTQEREMAEALAGQSIYSSGQIEKILHMPTMDAVRGSPTAVVLGQMLILDFARLFRLAALRRKAVGWSVKVWTIGGLLSTGNSEVEQIVTIIRRKASLSKRILFLDRAQRLFHLWHVVHRPFSYAFVVLALIHIVNAVRLGYF
jgi:hypothetical protein